MENEDRNITSRASSTSSLGREVRCGCQFYQSDLLLPERRALVGRPPSRNMMQAPPSHTRIPYPSEHEYELIAHPPTPPMIVKTVAPVVRITDTDMMPVADSDDSIEDRGRYHSRLTLDSDIILPLDGQLEDSAMEDRELVETIDTSDEQESTQQLQDRLEAHFLTAPRPGLESSTDGENNTNQVASSVQEKLPDRHSSHGFHAKLRSQAGKLRFQFGGIQKPHFTMPSYRKSEKNKSTSTATNEQLKIEKPKSEKNNNKKASKMERFKMALPERPRFSFPDTSKLSLPSRSKFNLKGPNINFSSSFKCPQKSTASSQDQGRHSSRHSTYDSRKTIFDFPTYSQIFNRKSKNRAEYATSSPKESRAQSAASATFPRTKKSFRARWAQRFGDTKPSDKELEKQSIAVERSRPWRHLSFEEPRLDFSMQGSKLLKESGKLPWETSEQKPLDYQGKIQDAGYKDDSQEHFDPEASKTDDETSVGKSFNRRVYSDQAVYREIKHTEIFDESENEVEIGEVDVLKFERIESLENTRMDDYEGRFPPVDPRKFRKISSEEFSSVRSESEQQLSRQSSCERRRLGVIEKIDVDDCFVHQKDISQDDMSVERSIASEICEALEATPGNSLVDVDVTLMPPQRPNRTRSLRKRKENFSESYNASPHSRLKREKTLCCSEASLSNPQRTGSSSSAVHRVVYQADTISRGRLPAEPLDNIIIVKPTRKKSRSFVHSNSQVTTESSVNIEPCIPTEEILPAVPIRRKRIRRQEGCESEEIQNGNVLRQNGMIQFACNEHGEWNNFENTLHREHPSTPPSTSQVTSASVDHKIMDNLSIRLKQDIAERPPVPPKRSSHSRTASLIQDEDRTSHGAESLPEVGYIDDEIDADDSQEQLPGYAAIEKCEETSRQPAPRRFRHKFATTPRIMTPKRPQRGYSTLRPVRRRSLPCTQIIQLSEDVKQYMDVDSDWGNKNLRSGEVLSKMQGRPLPAPPRPPRSHRAVRNSADYYEPGAIHLMTEVVASTQTDSLPNDHVIEEEITQVKLIMAPSRSGSEVQISTEKISTPTCFYAPSIPPLPIIDPLEGRRVSEERQAMNIVNEDSIEDQSFRSERVDDGIQRDLREVFRAASLLDEPLRINSLEVENLRVNRLSVSQLEAYNIASSKIDAVVVSASEITEKVRTIDSSIGPYLLQEIRDARSHHENENEVQERQPSRMEDPIMATSNGTIQAILPTIERAHSIRRSPTRDVDSSLRTKACRLVVGELDAMQTIGKIVGKNRTQPSSEPKSVQTQVLEANQLEPDAKFKAEMGRTTFPCPSTSRESSMENNEKLHDRSTSRSESSSPSRGLQSVRQTAYTVKSIPSLILGIPDTMDAPVCHTISSESKSQRAIISYSNKKREQSHGEITQPSQETSPTSLDQFGTSQTSQIPDKFIFLAPPTTQEVETEPNITETTQRLLKALSIIGTRTMRHFVNYIASRVGKEESCNEIRAVELILCALLLIVAGLIIMIFASPRTVTHHHHWDYFNPPQ